MDIYHRWGLEAFGQTDLDQRVHRNQTTAALGKMSFGILQSFLNRVERNGMLEKLPDLSHIHRQFQFRNNQYEQTTSKIIEEERPPMITIPAYREKFGLEKN